MIVAAVARASVAALASEELDEPLGLDAAAPLIVAIDPIDGSSNIEANISIGAIFSLLPARPGADAAAGFRQPGTASSPPASPSTARKQLALTLGEGTDVYTLDPSTRRFVLTAPRVTIPPYAREYTDQHLQLPPLGCRGARLRERVHAGHGRCARRGLQHALDGLSRRGSLPHPRARWVFLYPGDLRPGYEHGRLRLLYEGKPARLPHRAGRRRRVHGRALPRSRPHALHERVPVVMGSRAEVAYIERLYREPDLRARSPLFGRRSLLRDW